MKAFFYAEFVIGVNELIVKMSYFLNEKLISEKLL